MTSFIKNYLMRLNGQQRRRREMPLRLQKALGEYDQTNSLMFLVGYVLHRVGFISSVLMAGFLTFVVLISGSIGIAKVLTQMWFFF